MKKVRNLLLVLLAAVLCLLLLTGCGEKDVTVSVTLVNRSGREISSISITPSTSTEWDTEFVDGAFADGETISANLGTYKESEVPSAYNILVYNDENYILYDTSVDELDFAIQDGDYIIFLPPEGEVPIEIAHDYDPSDYDEADETAYAFEETEPTLSGDLSGYTGWGAVLLRHQRGLRVDRHQPLRRAGRPRLRRGRGREHHALHGG